MDLIEKRRERETFTFIWHVKYGTVEKEVLVEVIP